MSDPFADKLYPKRRPTARSSTRSRRPPEPAASAGQVPLAWLRHNPVVVAPFVGASKPSHVGDALASLKIGLTDEEVAELKAP